MDSEEIQIIKDALESEGELTDYEWDFINSLADKESDYELSEKQAEVLNKIGDKL